jgi:hypothetical protein
MEGKFKKWFSSVLMAVVVQRENEDIVVVEVEIM